MTFSSLIAHFSDAVGATGSQTEPPFMGGQLLTPVTREIVQSRKFSRFLHHIELDAELRMVGAPKAAYLVVPVDESWLSTTVITRVAAQFTRALRFQGFCLDYEKVDAREELRKKEDLYLLVSRGGHAQVLSEDRILLATIYLRENRDMWGKNYFLCKDMM